jgi:hypothetical protein
MTITCPFCSVAGEIPDKLQFRTLRCRHCGTRFQPKPSEIDELMAAFSKADDDSEEHAIDVDHLVRQPTGHLAITVNDGSPLLRHAAKHSRTRGDTGGALKFGITILALAWNILLVYPAVLSTILQTSRAKARGEIVPILQHGYLLAIPIDDEMLGYAVIIGFFMLSLPFLGAFVSHAKRRGLAEGYDLVTFFGPIGLIVALCLPTNRESVGT